MNRDTTKKWLKVWKLLLVSFLLYAPQIQAFSTIPEGYIDTVAGNGDATFSGDGGLAINASLKWPYAHTVDTGGNIYIADSYNNRIRRVDFSTDIITTVAGNGACCNSGDGGPAISAALGDPLSVAVDANGNLFISSSNVIRRVDATTGIITTVAGGCNAPDGLGDGGPAIEACIRNPDGIALDSEGNIFIAEDDRDRVRRVDVNTGIITTYAGTGAFGFSGDGGPATNATFKFPTRVAVDKQGNLFIADLGNNRVRKVDAITKVITTVAGGGNSHSDNIPATDAIIFPSGLTVDNVGNLFIVDDNLVRKIDAITQIITTVAGSGDWGGGNGDGGPALEAILDWPTEVAIDTNGNLTITESNASRIRRVFLGGTDSDGDGVPDEQDICLDGDDNVDADGDSVPDFCDPCPNDTFNDADGDTVCGDVDNCPSAANTDQTDTDGDGVGDVCNDGMDSDDDEWKNELDNCPTVLNPDQADYDGDGYGDVCDVCPNDPGNDADGDGYCFLDDNCPLVANSDQIDTDGDVVGDVCDADDDNDGLLDGTDNCSLVYNPGQADFDLDGQGDSCDLDADGDNIVDAEDQCLLTLPNSVVNVNGCSIVQLCPCDVAWKNHGAYVSCVAHKSNEFLSASFITAAEKDAIVSEAGQSTCGAKK